jgi:hypothetical protein
MDTLAEKPHSHTLSTGRISPSARLSDKCDHNLEGIYKPYANV